MHLRFLTRLQAVAALVVFSLLAYTPYIYPSLRARTHLTRVFGSPRPKLVVFGDSFSDTGARVGDVKPSFLRKHGEEGPRWTEVFCSQMSCDVLDFAWTATSSNIYSGGVVTDNDVYANTTSRNETGAIVLLPDLREQVAQWLQYEQSRGTAHTGQVIFAITLGFWDLWQYATLDLTSAKAAVSESIYTLFHQLNNVTSQFAESPSFIIPQLHDATFTPMFQSLADGGGNRTRDSNSAFSEAQHKMVYMTLFWNTLLRETAESWKGGRVFLPDWNAWLSDQVRAAQMQSSNIKDANGVGAGKATFSNVTGPCVSEMLRDIARSGEAGAVTALCENPRNHLFWNEIQFGPLAHQLLGERAAGMFHANESANARAGLQATPTEDADKRNGLEISEVHLIPSMAPGN